jgi:hypothetical protein
MIRDQCYDFKNIFAEEIEGKIGDFDLSTIFFWKT